MYQNAPSQMVRQPVEDTSSNYGYAPKSRLIYSRKGLNSAASKRSRTSQRMSNTAGSRMNEQLGPYVGTESQGDTKSRLNTIVMKRFNEAVPEAGPKSQTKSVFSKSKSQVGSKIGSNAGRSVFSQQQKKMDIYKAVDKLDDL